MHIHDCDLIFDFIFNKIIIFLNSNSTKMLNKSISPISKLLQILGCYNFTPLKMNLVLEIRTMLTQITVGMFSLDHLLFPK